MKIPAMRSLGFMKPGTANVLIDGQFGSTGKGMIAGHIALNDQVDVGVTNASANAGHTCIIQGKKIVTYHLPTSSVIANCDAYLNAGSIIDPNVLRAELRQTEFDPKRLFIHPRAAVIGHQDHMVEGTDYSPATKIASTRHGVGSALARKINRTATLAKDDSFLQQFILEGMQDVLRMRLRRGESALIEVPQGVGLGINSGFNYPHCTSREISVSQALADAQLHPLELGNVMATFRTYPIRVGNIYNGDGQEIGNSGPFYPDSVELSWGELGIEPEITTVTKRVRRVATFSVAQVTDAFKLLEPTHVFLNFVNYVKERGMFHRINDALDRMGVVMLYGVGPDSSTNVLTSTQFFGGDVFDALFGDQV